MRGSLRGPKLPKLSIFKVKREGGVIAERKSGWPCCGEVPSRRLAACCLRPQLITTPPGYDGRLIEMVVSAVASMHVVINFLPEMLEKGKQHLQVRALMKGEHVEPCMKL
jgi:hypothetical protein